MIPDFEQADVFIIACNFNSTVEVPEDNKTHTKGMIVDFKHSKLTDALSAKQLKVYEHMIAKLNNTVNSNEHLLSR